MKSGLNNKAYFVVTAIILAVTLPSLAHGPNCRHNYPKIDDIPHHVHLKVIVLFQYLKRYDMKLKR